MLETHNTGQGYFITGSDTGVGKTWVSCRIIQQLKSRVKSLKVRKPVESGCALSTDNELIPADGTMLFEANDSRESLQLVTPYRFYSPLSPDLAARKERQLLYLDQLEQAVIENTHAQDVILVEGAGGFYSPIAEDGLNADLARRLQLEVIIVVEDRLGAINQALLTVKAVESEGLRVRLIILNQNADRDLSLTDNLSALKKRSTYAVYSCPYLGMLPELNLQEPAQR